MTTRKIRPSSVRRRAGTAAGATAGRAAGAAGAVIGGMKRYGPSWTYRRRRGAGPGGGRRARRRGGGWGGRRLGGLVGGDQALDVPVGRRHRGLFLTRPQGRHGGGQDVGRGVAGGLLERRVEPEDTARPPLEDGDLVPPQADEVRGTGVPDDPGCGGGQDEHEEQQKGD